MTGKTTTVRTPFHAIFTNSNLIAGHNVVIDTSPHRQGGVSFKERVVLVGAQLSSSKMHLRPFIGKDYLSFPSSRIFWWGFIGAMRELWHSEGINICMIYKRDFAHAWIYRWSVPDIEKLKIKWCPFPSLHIGKTRNVIFLPFNGPHPSPDGRDLGVGTFFCSFGCAFCLTPQSDGGYTIDTNNDQHPEVIFFVKWLWVLTLVACAFGCAIRFSGPRSGFHLDSADPYFSPFSGLFCRTLFLMLQDRLFSFSTSREALFLRSIMRDDPLA